MALKYLNIFDITKNLLFPFMVSYSRVNLDTYGRLFDSEYNQIAFLYLKKAFLTCGRFEFMIELYMILFLSYLIKKIIEIRFSLCYQSIIK